jgi:hypothetical protein
MTTSASSSTKSTQNPDRVKMVVYAKNTAQPPVMAALVQQLEAQKARLEFEVLTDAALVLKSVEQTTMTVVILALNQKEELVEILNVITQIQARLQSGLLRVMVLNGMNHPRVIALLRAKGVHEIIDFNTTIKALNHKIKNAFLLVTQTFQRLQNQNIRASTVVGNEAAGRSGRNAGRGDSSGGVQWEKSTEHLGDIWWIPSAKNLRNVMGRWLIDMLGPGPAAGSWEETTYERNGEKGWTWKLRVPTDTTFLPRSGRWIFFGRQPEFIWQKNLWAFVSKMPYLAFYAEGQSDAEFVRINSPSAGKLIVFENSEVSRTFLPKIQASLEASLKLSKTADASNEIRGNFESGQENAGVAGGDFMPSGLGSNVPAPAGYSSSAGAEEEPADWNDHTGAVGFGFKAKDLRVGQDGARGKWRNALTTDEALGGKLGMAEVRQSGITSGAKTFDRMIFDIHPATRNGIEIVPKAKINVIEMTEDRGIFELSQAGAVERDRFVLKVEFHLGDVERKFELEWAVDSVQLIEGAGALVQGAFSGSSLAELGEILKLVAQRQLELKDFFLVAKGA